MKPHDLTAEGRAAAERVVERVAGRLAAAGCDEIAWSSDELDAALARIDAQGRRAGKPEELGWMTSGLLAFVLSAAAEAPTHRPLRDRLRAAVVAEVEGRWGVVVDVHPPGYTWRPPLL